MDNKWVNEQKNNKKMMSAAIEIEKNNIKSKSNYMVIYIFGLLDNSALS